MMRNPISDQLRRMQEVVNMHQQMEMTEELNWDLPKNLRYSPLMVFEIVPARRWKSYPRDQPIYERYARVDDVSTEQGGDEGGNIDTVDSKEGDNTGKTGSVDTSSSSYDEESNIRPAEEDAGGCKHAPTDGND
ncbi:unnamed protein product [Ilex paraguariensis]|uniref:Uncharacterized protein n=1 Tax=Ilex paraguariensis TaxID=185542 RepID=A0ABC8TVQ2_9AQUA